MGIEDFCGEVFFDPQQTLNATDPHFSDCFIDIVIDLIPCAYLLLLSLPYFIYLHGIGNNPIPASRLFVLKCIATILLCAAAWTRLFYSVWQKSKNVDVPAVELTTPTIVGLSMLYAFWTLFYERKKGVRSSALLTLYWLLYVILWVLPVKEEVQLLLKDEALSLHDLLRSITFFISYVLVWVNFILCWFLDSPPLFSGDDRIPTINESEQTCNYDQDEKKEVNDISPEESATFLSRLSFWWLTRLVFLGYKRPLVTTDLWLLNKANEAGTVVKRFLKNWTPKQRRSASDGSGDMRSADEEVFIRQPLPETAAKKSTLLRALLKTFLPYFLLGSSFKLCQDVLSFVSPQLLSALIAFTSDPNAPVWQGYALAVALFAVAFVQSLFLHQYFNVAYVSGMRLRSAIVSSIYRKALVMSNGARRQNTVGEMVNLMSVDAQRLMDLMTYINMLWSGPLQIILAVYFLWQVLGPSVLAGVAVMILLIPINAVIANKTRSLQLRQMKYKDDRIKLMNEILNGIKVLKLYAWESSFLKKVMGIRNDELKVLRSAAYLDAASSFTWICAPYLVSLTTFAMYVLIDENNVLDAQKAFVSLSLFNILRFPMSLIPMVISSTVQANISLKRMEKFLNGDEIDPDNVDRSSSGDPKISIERGTFSWEQGLHPTLRNVNVKIEEGSLVAVVGKVGSGKSSLISALLGDMEKKSGTVKVNGSVAYVPQQAWIQNATVRNNITFEKPMDPCKYQDVIASCELKSDFDMLPGGDLTEIGEKGINLSGGQKQRVSVARAVYQDAEIYLLDDPLSAVDAHVGKNIFDNVIGPRGYLKRKTRVLVTHGVSFLPQVDKIIVLVDGKITEVGDYYQLLEKDGEFAEFLRNYAQTDDSSEEFEEDASVLPINPEMIAIEKDSIFDDDIDMNPSNNAKRQLLRQLSRDQFKPVGPYCKYVPLKKKMKKDRVCQLPKKVASGNQLIQKETAETGNVKLAVFMLYVRAVGTLLSIVICILYAVSSTVQLYGNIWLSEWSNEPVINGTQQNTGLRLGVYGVIGLGQGLAVLLCTFILSFGAVSAARLMHNDMLLRVFRAPMSFFDTTPLGRIVNRFSKDIYAIDEVIPDCFQMFLGTFFQTIASFFVIIYSTPIFAAVLVPLLVVYYIIQRFYVRTSRQLKRMESVSRSPIYSHFGESITGASTIRAYAREESFIFQNEHKVDLNQMAYYPNIIANRWLAVRLEFVGNCIVLFSAIFAVAGKETISAGIVGLSVSYALQITATLNWMVQQTSELEMNIVAVERVKEYSEVEQEAPLIMDDSRPPATWPRDGAITFANYSTRYRKELDLVVKGISVDIKGGEKVGIVGRTGAGKSSLTLALFRIIEASGGEIRIDGFNIHDMGLEDLRSKLSIIPQDPVLFSGSLRMNLDPFDAYTDYQLWNALEHSHLKVFVEGLPDKLDHEVSEGGENLSVGQRQLLCLARALLRNSQILVLDEATAAVDLATDDLIQATIRVQFERCTTFTIAHRLNTIMDSTRVVVMDAGKIAEFDSPANLLEAKGIFYSMAQDAGLVS